MAYIGLWPSTLKSLGGCKLRPYIPTTPDFRNSGLTFGLQSASDTTTQPKLIVCDVGLWESKCRRKGLWGCGSLPQPYVTVKLPPLILIRKPATMSPIQSKGNSCTSFATPTQTNR